MKCVHCGADVDDEIEIDGWNRCPICHTPMLGFSGDVLDIAVEMVLRNLTVDGIATMPMNRYPFPKPGMHYAHFLGKLRIAEVYDMCPCEMSGEDMEAWAWADGFDGLGRIDPFGDVHKTYADEWFSKRYGGDWMTRTWTVIRWKGWTVCYFKPKQ